MYYHLIIMVINEVKIGEFILLIPVCIEFVKYVDKCNIKKFIIPNYQINLSESVLFHIYTDTIIHLLLHLNSTLHPQCLGMKMLIHNMVIWVGTLKGLWLNWLPRWLLIILAVRAGKRRSRTVAPGVVLYTRFCCCLQLLHAAMDTWLLW